MNKTHGETGRLLNFAADTDLPLIHNHRHQFAARHALSIFRSEAIYTLIPKNACSTLRFSIAVANGCIAADGHVRWIHQNNDTFVADLRSLVNASFTFVILRCPIDRLVSCFLDKIVDMLSLAWSLTPNYESDASPADLSFREFVALLETKLKADVHWRPQADFLVYRRYDRYFDFRQMDAVRRDLQECIGLDVIDVRDKTAHAISAYERIDGDYTNTPARELMAMKREGALPSFSSLVDEAILAKLERLYAEDVAIYSELAGGKLTQTL